MPNTISIGREGWIGVGVETTAGQYAAPDKYIPFNSCDLTPVTEVVDDESAKGIREATWGSESTQKRGEGDVEINLDVENSPFFLFPALGTKSTSTASGESSVYEHVMTRKSSNPPKTLTVLYNNTVVTEKYTNAVVNSAEVSFSDGFATLSANIIANSPSNTTSGSKNITEENVLSFSDAKIYFGSDFQTAFDAYTNTNSTQSVNLSEFNVEVNNNAEAHYLSGSIDPSDISMGEFEATGDYTLFFENEDEKNAYQNQTKRAMVVSLKGGSIGSAETEEVLVKIPKFHLTDRGIDTSTDDFVTENPSFSADYYSGGSSDINGPTSFEMIVRNQTEDYPSP